MLSSQQKTVVYANNDFDQKNNILEVNANYLFPVIVETNVLNWQVSPSHGCKQMCLELVGKNKSRMTTVVQFSPGRTYKQFGHIGGVEVLVLSGVYSDANGDYSAGCYVRTPAKIYRDLYTRNGCTILLKLGYFQRLDRNRVVIDSGNSTDGWIRTREPGVSQIDLHYFSEEKTCLYRIRPECWFVIKNNSHIVEIFVCEGSITIDDNHYETGTWLRYPVGGKVKVKSKEGAVLYVNEKVYSRLA